MIFKRFNIFCSHIKYFLTHDIGISIQFIIIQILKLQVNPLL